MTLALFREPPGPPDDAGTRPGPSPSPSPSHLSVVPPQHQVERGGQSGRTDWPAIRAALDALDSSADLEPTSTVSVPARELVDLLHKLRTQPLIDQAKGIVMGYYGLDADTAFGVLRRWSQDRNMKLHVVARTLVDGAAQAPCSDVPPHDLIDAV